MKGQANNQAFSCKYDYLTSQFFHRYSYDINLEILSKLEAFHLLKEQQQKIIIVLLPDVVVYTIHL